MIDTNAHLCSEPTIQTSKDASQRKCISLNVRSTQKVAHQDRRFYSVVNDLRKSNKNKNN